MKNILLLLCFFVLNHTGFSQDFEKQMSTVNEKLTSLKKSEDSLNKVIENIKFQKIQYDLQQVGLPSNDFITHNAMLLKYDEAYEQADWVAHMILPDIKFGVEARSNDFRTDALVKTGTAVDADYFTVDTLPTGEVKYTGFGFDRGHLAPSADFRWSNKALSESFLYSNMSPQKGEFNRGIWSDIEGFLRGYVTSQNVPLYVVTAPVLDPSLKRIDRGRNKVAIPLTYVKAAIDLQNKRGIAFIINNEGSDIPIDNFAFPIDSAEAITGLDFFPKSTIDESKIEKEDWFANIKNGDVDPISQLNLSKGLFNSMAAKKQNGKMAIICGTVVNTRVSNSGKVWFFLDRQYPEYTFGFYIDKEDLINFPYTPQTHLINEQVCVAGFVRESGGKSNMKINKSENIYYYEGNNN